MDHNEFPDCTKNCKSTQHGDIITAAISRRSVTDEDLCSYLNFVCTRCESVRDSVGRTALHVAASCGRVNLVRWLVENRGANINAKDEESGFTALHRSVFYGKINVAVELIKLGANVSLPDSDSLTMLEHLMKDGYQPDPEQPGELYVWGSNANHSLGSQQTREIPELFDLFHKKFSNEYVRKVYIEKFHSVIVSSSGRVFCCGHGLGGRLGLGTQKTVLQPELVKFPETSQHEIVLCIDAAISRDHSLYLCSDGNVYACGFNFHKVLGISPPPPELLIPRQLKRFPEEIKGVRVGRYHSVAWSSNTLFTWGLNAGQLGHKSPESNNYVISPRAVNTLNLKETKIEAVDSSDGAVVVLTEKGDIYVLHEYQCRKIASRQLNIVQISTFGGKLNLSGSKDPLNEPTRELKVAVLTNTGNLFLWRESDPQLCRCIFSINRAIVVRQMVLNNEGLAFVTNDGEAFHGFIKLRKKKTVIASNEKSAFHKFLEREDCTLIKITKFPRIHRAVFIATDAKSQNFCVVQVPPYKRFSEPAVMKSEFKNDLRNLMEECHKDDDLHDVVFRVENSYFAAHRYIVASKSDFFRKFFLHCKDTMIFVENFNSAVFEQFILYIYTNSCDLLECSSNSYEKKNDTPSEDSKKIDENISTLEVSMNTIKNKSSANIKDPVRMLHEMAKKFGCTQLYKRLLKYDKHKNVIKKNDAHFKFEREKMSDFYDVTINCAYGSDVQAHKCILAARADYFNSLFSSRWHGTEVSTISLPYSKAVVEALLEYLYTDSVSYNSKDQDNLFKLIILADQLFIPRLKEHCENLMFKNLNLKTAAQLLMFADMYHADKLQECSLKFIVSNIAAVLELGLLDSFDETLLKLLSDFYFEYNSKIWCRVITPYSIAPSEEEIAFVRSSFPVSLTDNVKHDVCLKNNPKKRQRAAHKNSLSITDTLDQGNSLITEVEIKEENIQFPDAFTENSISNRLRKIKFAEEELRFAHIEPEFVKLSSRNSSDVLSTSFEEFPLLNSPPSSSFYQKSYHKFDTKHKIVKIPQKQRKRLSSENSSDICESPKSPWKNVEFGTSSSPEMNINDIIMSEKKQRENLVKIKSKLLVYTQIEDKAIEELCKFYNANQVDDEFLSVERVNVGSIAVPIWVPGVKK